MSVSLPYTFNSQNALDRTPLEDRLQATFDVLSNYLEAGLVGPQGPAGATGLSGGSFDFVQASASTTWVVVHNLGYQPTATFFDSTGRRFQASYEHDSVNQLTASLVHSTAGNCYCS